ncbi:MAG: sortase [Candidatus Woesebacteria bacterium]|nr:sortase [Candidatus Woesebacteria bacterium]
MHYEIYHSYSLENSQPPKKSHGFLVKAAKLTAILGIVFLLISFLPAVWYNILSGGTQKISQLLAKPQIKKDALKYQEKKVDYQPQIDNSLSFDTKLKIPSIRVDTKIHEAVLDNYESALKLGVWRVSDFGSPYDRSKPTILAAHRYGYLAWSNLYRRLNSFYNLPKLKVGDIVEIDWQQRKYVYSVYAESKGEEITDYSADLILYTCETLNSPIRIFKYARLLGI